MKAALISGSSSGIGKAIAEKFLENGIKVVGLARDHSKFIPNKKNYIPIEAD
ncbi:MAG: SDR family NAD(P)-dependent oxidoreductase, partial [Alphaproteobacteria bacterium]|nr:SDR family NAD(P)-dependent oxidoreductase [Alphaproteobacteria bacterium]